MKVYYSEEPKKLERVGNAFCLYRYDIRKEVHNMGDMEGASPVDQWVAEEVKVYLPITANAITMAVITDKWDSDQEAKLVNEYNAVTLGVYGDAKTADAQKKVDAYKEFLTERARLKNEVDEYCKQNDIA